MARPAKKGLDYFPFDVGFFEDIKIKRLKSRYGTDGICLYLYILTQIYAEGYYLKIENEEDFYDDINDTLAIEEGKARQIIKYCSDRSMIVEIIPGEIDSPQIRSGTVKGVKVLTAAGIQMRYAQAMKKRKKSLAKVKGEYWLLSDEEEAELEAFYKSQSETDNFENNDSSSENNHGNSPINSANEIKPNETISDGTSYKEVSKEESNKKEKIESYDEIFEGCHVTGRYKEVMIEFIRHLKTSYGVVMLNDRLYGIITALDEKYRNDELSKRKEIRRAIVNGYRRLECESEDS